MVEPISYKVNDGAEPPEKVVKNGTEKDNSSGVTITMKGDKNGDGAGKDDKKKDEPQKSVGAFEVFRFATFLDVVFMILGSLGGALHGAGLPAMILVFGDMIDSFVDNGRLLNEAAFNKTGVTEEQFRNSIATGTNLSDYHCKEITGLKCTQAMKDSLDIVGQMSTFAIYYVIIGCGVMLCAYLQVSFWMVAAERQTRKIRTEFFRSVLHQEIGWFDTHEPGELNTRLSDDVNKIHDGIGDKLGSFMQWTCGFLAGIIIGFVKGWKLTLVILAVSPLIGVAAGIMSKFAASMTGKELEAYAKAGAVAEEVISSIRTVVAFGGQKKECVRYENNLVDAKKYGEKKALTGGLGMGFVWLVIFGAYALGFGYGSFLAIEERENYSVGNMLVVFFCVLIAAFSIGNAGPNLQNYATARGAAYTVFQIIDRKPLIDSSSSQGQTPQQLMGNIQFKNVQFTYPAREDVKVLKGLDLTVDNGKTVALVGSSGCGKSTTVSLIQRFYDVESGSIELDGIDIRDLNVKWLRNHIGVVSQEPILFHTTVAENIRYGKDGVTQEDIERAAKEANAHDFISSLPEKYETLVGERGAQMSGGQKQRIAIARALVKNPRVLLLDEATSALDTESEAIVQEALDKARQGRTTIVIAHRLSTVRTADLIAAFSGGVLQEQGTHEVLMRNEGGVYHTLVTTQSKREEAKKKKVPTATLR